jgi:hypothetical protein
MTDFIATALDLLPTPAALYEVPTNRYVHANRQALDRGGFRLTGHEDHPEVAALTALHHFDHLRAADRIPAGETYAEETADHGWVLVSTITATAFHSRPDLRLVTMHDHLPLDVAQMHHLRTSLMLDINETTERAIKAAQTAMLMLHDSVAGQRAMLDQLNNVARDLMAENLEESSPNPLTLVSSVPQG